MSDEPPLEEWARENAVLEAVRIARRSPFEDFERDVRPRLARLTREQLAVLEEALTSMEEGSGLGDHAPDGPSLS